MSDYNWESKYKWECTQFSHIFKNVTTGEFHYSDEAEQLDKHGYKEIDDCQNALRYYVVTNLM